MLSAVAQVECRAMTTTTLVQDETTLSQLARGLTGSEILRISGQITALKAEGREICNLTVGDFSPTEFRIPARLEALIQEALAAGQTNYPPSDGVLDLRKAVVQFYRRELGLTYGVESCLIAGGSRPIIFAAFAAVVDPGDKVVYSTPSWNNNHYTYLMRAEPVEVVVGAETNFLPTAEQLVYWQLTFGDNRHYTPPQLVPESTPWTIFVDGISKAFAATGLRVGWTMAPPYVTARMRDILGHVGAWAPKAEQVAVATFLGEPQEMAAFRERMQRELRLRLDLLHDGIESMRAAGLPARAITPQGAIYLSAQFNLIGKRGIRTNDDIRKLLLEQAGFAVVPFQAFGAKREDGWFRLSAGAVSPADIEAGLARLRNVLAAYA